MVFNVQSDDCSGSFGIMSCCRSIILMVLLHFFEENSSGGRGLAKTIKKETP
jgi:hypothetical protein